MKIKKPRPKKCKQCGDKFQPERQLQACCSIKCAIDISRIQQEKKKRDNASKSRAKERKATREANRRRKEYKDNHYPTQFRMTKEVIQRWCNNVRDADLPCISCGCKRTKQFCGGHYKTAGGNPELALDTRNINGQCNRTCNMALSGNIYGTRTSHGYRDGIVMRFGRERLDWLDGPHEPKKYTCEQLRELRAYYARLTREGIKDDSDRPL